MAFLIRITELPKMNFKKDYQKAVDFLTINPDKTLIQKIEGQYKVNNTEIQERLKQKDIQINLLF